MSENGKFLSTKNFVHRHIIFMYHIYKIFLCAGHYLLKACKTKGCRPETYALPHDEKKNQHFYLSICVRKYLLLINIHLLPLTDVDLVNIVSYIGIWLFLLLQLKLSLQRENSYRFSNSGHKKGGHSQNIMTFQESYLFWPVVLTFY